MPENPTLTEYDARITADNLPAEQLMPRDKRLVALEELVAAEAADRAASRVLTTAQTQRTEAAERLKVARAAYTDAMRGTQLQ